MRDSPTTPNVKPVIDYEQTVVEYEKTVTEIIPKTDDEAEFSIEMERRKVLRNSKSSKTYVLSSKEKL